MFVIIGIVIVMGAVVGGFIMEHGNLHVLIQPIELLIIGGAAVGAFVISAPMKVIMAVVGKISALLGPKSASKKGYLELLALLYSLFSKIRKEGLISVEADIEDPKKSDIFKKYKSVLSNHHASEFICDNLKVIVSANVPAHELDNLMDIELESHHHNALAPSHAITKIADSLPALGIVAAVLGVVITMGKISEPPAVLGHSIGSALVGTFLGILLSYGFVGPMATNLEYQAEEESIYYQIIKVALVSFVGGSAPQMAVEFGRRAIPGKDKPSFSELEAALRGGK